VYCAREFRTFAFKPTKMAETARRPRSFRPFQMEAARAIISELQALDGALMPILHALQEEFGYVDPATEPVIAEILNITRADVHGVVTFYRDFRRSPPGLHRVAFCRAEACQAAGGERLAKRAEAALGVKPGETTPDGQVSLEAVYCLGLCSVAPSAMIDGRVVGRLDDTRIEAVLAAVGQ
jgi:formate dehydrogenase subunit gamma